MRFLFLTLFFCLTIAQAMAQDELAIKMDAYISYLNFGPINVRDIYKANDRIAEHTLSDGSSLKVEIGINPLRRSVLLMAVEDRLQENNNIMLGFIRVETKSRKPANRTYVNFNILVGDSEYKGQIFDGLGTSDDTRMLMIRMPEEIRIPIDRANIAILQFKDRYFFQSSGTFGLEGKVRIESSNPPQRRTRRR